MAIRMEASFLKRQQQGYFFIIAVLLILLTGVMGSIIAYLFANRARISVAEQYGLNAFYIAESGLEISARLLTMPSIAGSPSRLSCTSLTGTAEITNAPLGAGSFTAMTINNSPVYANSTLSAAINSSDSVMAVNTTSGFAPSGKLLLDREAIDYAAISGNSFIGVQRGVSGTNAANHAAGASVGQYLCSIDIKSGIPNLTTPNYQRELQWNVTLQDGWVVGNSSGGNFRLSHWNYPSELNWTAVSISNSNSDNLNGISMLSNADGWTVGNVRNNQFNFLHWNGSAWQVNLISNACSGQDLQGVSMVSSQEGWAVGNRYQPTNCNSGNQRYTVMRWNGSQWTLLTPTSSPSIPADNNNNQNLNAIHVIDTSGNGIGNLGFAVGNNGQILKYNCSNWSAETSPTNRRLNSVYIVSASEAWAVGNNGTIIRWNGSSWATISSPTNNQLNSVAMLDTNEDGSANAGWAVGNGGEIVSYNGSTWSASSFQNSNLRGVALFNQNDAWVARQNGTLLHWNGNNWSSVSSGTSVSLNAIDLISAKTNPTSIWKQLYN